MRAVVGKGSSADGWERDGEGWNGGGRTMRRGRMVVMKLSRQRVLSS